MVSRPLRPLASLVLALAVTAAGCGGDDTSGPTPTPPGQPGPDAVADVSVPDVNDTSPRFGELVSPRDYLGKVSAWYFGHAT